MRIHRVWLVSIGIAVASHAGDFYLKDKAGNETGPFEFREGAKVSVGDREATISVRRGQIERQEEWDRLSRIRFPEIEFRETSVAEVVAVLQNASVQHDPDKRGVNMILNLAGAESAATNSILPRVTFRAEDISLMEIVKIVTNIAGLRYRLESGAIVFLPQNSPDGAIVTRVFDVLPTISGKLVDMVGELGKPGSDAKPREDRASQDAELKELFKELGVSWPLGSSVKYIPAIGKLAVANTLENLEILEDRLGAIDVLPCQIELELQFVAFKLSDLSKIAEGGIRRSELDELRARGAGRLIAAPKMTTQSGTQATVEGESTVIFPTEFAVTGLAGTNISTKIPGIAEPGNFEMQKVGAILTALPEVGSEGQMINVTLTPELVEDPVWHDYGHTWVTNEGITNRVRMEQPFFHQYSVNTTVSVSNGETVLVGGGMPTRDGQESVYCYLTVHLVDPKGNDLPRP